MRVDSLRDAERGHASHAGTALSYGSPPHRRGLAGRMLLLWSQQM